MGLTTLLAVGFALVAVAMAYAIIDVPSTGNARLSQRRFPWFLWFRQVPLLLASLILAAWWAVFRNVLGSEPFQPTEWRLRFIFFAVASYLSGGLLATIFLLIRKDRHKAPRGRFIDSFLRTGIVLSATFAGVCLWAMASRIFLVPAGNTLNYVFFAQALLLAGLLLVNFLFTSLASWVTKDEHRESWGRAFHDSFLRTGTIVLSAAFAGFCLWAMATRLFLFPSGTDFVLNRDCETLQTANQDQKLWFKTPPYPSFKLPAGTKFVKTSGSAGASLGENEFVLKRDCKAIEIPSEQKTTLPACTHVRFAGENLTAFQPVLVPAPARHALNYVCFAPALILGVLMLVNFLFTGLASRVTKDQDREWWGRSAAWILITIFGWIVFNVMVLWGAQAITATTTGNQLQVFFGQVKANPVAKAVLGAFGGVSGVAGALLALRRKLGKKLDQKGGFQWLLVVVAVVFFVLLSVVISWALLVIASQPRIQEIIARPGVGKTFQGERLFVIVFLTSITLSFGILMGFFIDVNKFSLHATYRNRLIRAFLAASRKPLDPEDPSPKARNPHLFTGFDPEDNFELHELKPEKPFHLINATLNVIKSKKLAWQERKAESFTMSRLHCGSWHVGYRPSAEYGDGITLGTALTISGAAANPNMGYHSSPVVSFLMTLFNVRLGFWLGNPGPPGARTWCRPGPGYAVGPLFSEAIGNTTDHSKYVNLSDGGHFENLGLYEMVLRRCKLILVVDAGQDFKYVFEDLGNAIRKIRIDLGIPVDIRVVSPKKSEGTVNHCAFGTIKYSVMDGPGTDGSLIYVKPLVSGDEPPDVSNYAAAHPEFPHETTTDQWFSESQLESYRLLGLHAVEAICGKDWKPKELPLFFEQVKRDLAVSRPGAIVKRFLSKACLQE
jgi:hypothetical protein